MQTQTVAPSRTLYITLYACSDQWWDGAMPSTPGHPVSNIPSTPSVFQPTPRVRTSMAPRMVTSTLDLSAPGERDRPRVHGTLKPRRDPVGFAPVDARIGGLDWALRSRGSFRRTRRRKRATSRGSWSRSPGDAERTTGGRRAGGGMAARSSKRVIT